MTRMNPQTYQRHVMVAMAIYVAVFLWVWPLAKAAGGEWIKAAYALAPVPPILYVIWLMARRVLASDELEQRTHLVGLGVAAAVASVFGIVAGFLAAAHVLPADGAAAMLVWIFPLMIVVYSLAQGYAAHRYGSSACYEEGLPKAIVFLCAAAAIAALAAYLYWSKGDPEGAATALGMGVGILAGAAFFTILKWWRNRSAHG